MGTPPPQTWPPPPDMPHPLSEHDDFLTARVLNAQSKPPMSRLVLTRELRQKTGLDLRQCLAVVNDFCDRNGILMPQRGTRLWLTLLPSLVLFMAAVLQLVFQGVFERKLDAAPTRLARHLLLGERIRWDGVCACILLAACALSLFNLRAVNTLARRKAEGAREKVAGLTGMGVLSAGKPRL